MTVLSAAYDRDLKRRVEQYLLDRHHPGLRSLDVEACGGTVTIRGKVRTFYEKQLCQNICRRVAGVIDVVDLVEVANGERSDRAERKVPAPSSRALVTA